VVVVVFVLISADPVGGGAVVVAVFVLISSDPVGGGAVVVAVLVLISADPVGGATVLLVLTLSAEKRDTVPKVQMVNRHAKHLIVFISYQLVPIRFGLFTG